MLQRGGEDGVCELAEEESSFLQEILSSLTPLTSCSLGVETVGLKVEEEEIQEEEEGPQEEKPPVSYQDEPSGSLMYQTTEEEEEEVATVSTGSPSSLDDEGDRGEEEEEQLVVEQFSQDCVCIIGVFIISQLKRCCTYDQLRKGFIFLLCFSSLCLCHTTAHCR